MDGHTEVIAKNGTLVIDNFHLLEHFNRTRTVAELSFALTFSSVIRVAVPTFEPLKSVHLLFFCRSFSWARLRAKFLRPAAARGHSSHVLYGRRGGKRFSIYVPEELVPEVRKAIANGRRLQELMSEAGVRYTHALKARRRKEAGQRPQTPNTGVQMLNEQDFAVWVKRTSLSDPARSVVAHIRTSQPARRVGGGRGNVVGRYPSRKMGVTQQKQGSIAERSRAGERPCADKLCGN